MTAYFNKQPRGGGRNARSLPSRGNPALVLPRPRIPAAARSGAGTLAPLAPLPNFLRVPGGCPPPKEPITYAQRATRGRPVHRQLPLLCLPCTEVPRAWKGYVQPWAWFSWLRGVKAAWWRGRRQRGARSAVPLTWSKVVTFSGNSLI